MKKYLPIGVIALLGLLALNPSWLRASQEPKVPAEQKEVFKTMEDVAEAFNKQNAKAIAALWTENGVYTNVSTGERLSGRKAIEDDFAKDFALSKKARLTLELQSLRMITADVASVEGTARVVKPNEAPALSTFQNILVKKDGRWLIDSVRETELPYTATSADHLKDLEWLIGEWTRKDDKTEVKVVGKWVANHNFLARRYSVVVDGTVQHEGTQIVGWDPIQKKIRSWTFDSDGSFGEGTWQKEGKNWTIRATGVLPDGKKSTTTQLITPLDENRYGWQIVARSVDGQLLPNIEQVVMQRKSAIKEKE